MNDPFNNHYFIVHGQFKHILYLGTPGTKGTPAGGRPAINTLKQCGIDKRHRLGRETIYTRSSAATFERQKNKKKHIGAFM